MGSNYYEAVDLEDNEPPPPAASEPEPARKMAKQLPQRGVDLFWEKFTTKNPGKVLSILPSDIYAKTKASKATKGLVKGQGAAKSYNQAASECKNAVEKIARECRRVNHKYRDPHFDIEWDLKKTVRDCLWSLEDSAGDELNPKSVKRVTDIFKTPQFFEDGPTASDVRQGNNGDCWFLSALCALCNKPGLIENICVAKDELVGVYGFVFHRDGEWSQTIIDDKLYLIASDWWESSDSEKAVFAQVNRHDGEKKYREANQTGSKSLYFAQCSHENETWLPLLEKAYAKAHGDFSVIEGGFTGEAIEDLTGGVTTELFTTDILDKNKFWSEEIMKVNEEFLFSCATGTFDRWQDLDETVPVGARDNIMPLHAYSIMEAKEAKGHRLLLVRNPWGNGEWKGAWSDGSKEWTPEWMQLLNHKFGDDGMFWISYEDLLRNYSSFERTRLFGSDWHVTQQWTTVDVPWTADYNKTKFNITLKQRSPIVIVLSQLDSRYFKGLGGQYYFQLHFRLDKEGEHDYIVRSHGNYSMNRSVSTDLELDAGTYSVLMKITAKRDKNYPTPEDVIRANVRRRQNKLIQVGLSYDLAHAKGEIRETEAEKQKRISREEKKKAKEKKKQYDLKRKQLVADYEYEKRKRARDKRQKQKREAYEAKKAAKAKAAEEVNGTVADDECPRAVDETSVEGGIEEQAASSGTKDNTGEEPAAADEADAAEEEEQEEKVPSADSDAAQAAQSFEKALKSIPAVTLNGEPAPASSGQAPQSLAAPSTLAPNDDYQYDSDGSFVSSIDSVLDFPRETIKDSDDAPADDDLPPANEGEENKEFEDDPWNAICVVGLRVYSKNKDGDCCVEVIQPKKEDETLDLDDASKGASGEVEGKPKETNGVKSEIEDN